MLTHLLNMEDIDLALTQDLMALHDKYRNPLKNSQFPNSRAACACIYILIAMMHSRDTDRIEQLMLSMTIAAAPELQAIGESVQAHLENN